MATGEQIEVPFAELGAQLSRLLAERQDGPDGPGPGRPPPAR
jgi:hypothetical protein